MKPKNLHPKAWAYRATPSGANFAETQRIIATHGFLWRPLFKATSQRGSDGRPPLHSYVGQIEPGDLIYIFFIEFFIESGARKLIGAFETSPKRKGAHPDGRASAIVRVEGDERLHRELLEAGYAPDPFLRRFTGFELRPAINHHAPPGKPRFIGLNAIGTFPA